MPIGVGGARPECGRPRIDPQVQKLIRHMGSSNPTWGKPRIQAEVRKIGMEVGNSTVWRYRSPQLNRMRRRLLAGESR